MADFVKYAQLFPGLRRTHRPLDFRGGSHEAAIIMCPFHTQKKNRKLSARPTPHGEHVVGPSRGHGSPESTL